MNILHIDSCPLGDHSVSRQYSAAAVAQLAADGAPSTIYRDIAASPLSHISGPLLKVVTNQWNSSIPMNAELRAEGMLGVLLLNEFQQADVAVIAAPMFNFSMPSTLKAWLDRLIHLQTDAGREIAGRTRVVLVVAGCTDAADPAMAASLAHHEAQLTAMFNALGATRLAIVRTGQDLPLQ